METTVYLSVFYFAANRIPWRDNKLGVYSKQMWYFNVSGCYFSDFGGCFFIEGKTSISA